MRVIAGSAKGVRLGRVPPGVRPMSDRAKEGLFSSLAPELPGSSVMDLFAGTGSLGIEALSRGADRTVFVERNRGALDVLRDNLVRARLSDRAEVVASDAASFLSNPPSRVAGPFDLVLADPPYDAAAHEVVALLEGPPEGWLAPGATVALTRGRRSSTPVIPVHWLVSRRLEYGDTAVLIFREA
jgi:16S rRNA (guanine(966)-N(2))-methyltransferase RsmD